MKLNIHQNNWTMIAPCAVLTGFILLFNTTVPAQETAPVYIDASQCRNIRVDMARVACYDALADQAANPPAASGQYTAPTAAAPVQGSSNNYRLSEENMKMREELARLRRAESGGSPDRIASYGKPGPRIEEEDGKEILYDRIAGLQSVSTGWVVTLESGQVWRQKEPKRYLLRVGQEVKLKPALWGSHYHLTVEDLGSFIRVERIK